MKFKATVTLRHDSGHDIDIEVSGTDHYKVAHVANTIKRTFGASAADITKRVNDVIDYSFSDRRDEHWYDFLRDFFGLRKKT